MRQVAMVTGDVLSGLLWLR